MQESEDKNHIEGHSELTYDKDRTISQIAQGLWQCIGEFTHNRNVFPEGDINSTYFAQATIRAWMFVHPEKKICATVFPLECDPICGLNWPKPDSVRSPISKKLIDLIRAESQPNGQGLDVSFAVAVVDELFDDNDMIRPAYEDTRPEAGMNEEEFFEYWLSGFGRREAE